VSKKKKTLDELLEEALVPEDEQPYEIPENWIWGRLGLLTTVKRGASPRPKGDPKYFGGNIGWLKISDLTNQGKYITYTDDSVTEAGKEKSVYVEENSLILSISASVGKVCINKIPLCIHDGFVKINSNNKILDENFLFYALQNALGQMMSKAKGATQVNINSSIVNDLSIPIPSVNEQKRIADRIETLFAKLDEAKQLIEETKEAFQLRRESILKLAFTGELTSDFRNNNILENSNNRLLKIQEERYKVTESKKEIAELDILFAEEITIDNNDWLYLKTSLFCHNITCGSTPSKDLSSTGEVPFLKVYNIVNNEIAFEYQPQYIPNEVHQGKLKKSRLQPNDVIMNIVGPPLKKIAIIPEQYEAMNMNQAIVRFRPISYVLPKYVYYCLQYEKTLAEVIEATRGVVGQSNISITQSRNLVMPIPSLEEQQEIVGRLEKLIDKEKTVLEIIPNEKDLEQLKQSILSKAFKGELGTNDPTDEPAIELLKSILQEKLISSCIKPKLSTR